MKGYSPRCVRTRRNISSEGGVESFVTCVSRYIRQERGKDSLTWIWFRKYFVKHTKHRKELGKGILCENQIQTLAPTLLDHSYSRDWLWNLESFKGGNKGAALYVESTTTVRPTVRPTVHNLLFYIRKLWLNNLIVAFLMVSCSCKIQDLLLFVYG